MGNDFDLAVIGFACRFPGADNPDAFWANLVGGVESIARLGDEELIAAGVSPGFIGRPDYVKASPVLGDPSLFDAGFFGYSPSEAAAMDPQHRILLELSHHALEDAACDPERYAGRIGVFAGSAMNTYFAHAGLYGRFTESYIPTLIATDKDFLATRISYKLGLRGPSMTVQTACSTSLVAVHLARQSLLSEETDLALAAAVSIRVPHRAGYFYDGSGVVSPDGHVRAFDAAAGGTVFGSGAGVLVLKRLGDALAEGDRIHAVIKGTAVNNDGALKAGYTAPSVDGQAEAVLEALGNAGVTPDEIGYLEAHGSGTPLGDEIEVRALTKAFRSSTARRGFCVLGSVKPNVGHLDAAAGMAGLIKTILILKHGSIPPLLHLARPNEKVDFPATPFILNPQVRDWPAGDRPRRAGVMATGMGGTNAHVVLEEAPATGPRDDRPGPHLLLLSAKTGAALDQAAQRLGDLLGDGSVPNGQSPLAAVARTLQTGRKFFPHRRFGVFDSPQNAAAALRAPASPHLATGTVPAEGPRPVVFLLPGIGDHYLGMGRGLRARFPAFRQEMDRCAEILQPLLGEDIREVLYPAGQPEPPAGKSKGIDLKRMLGQGGAKERSPAQRKLDQTLYSQPALFTVEYALARLWMSWGIEPGRLVGHSMGEYVAACLAGVFTLPEALGLIAARARLVNELPEGAMLGVMLPERDVLPLLGEDLSISLLNGPNLCVVAGPAPAIEQLKPRLKERGAIFRPVRNGHAFHSHLLEPIAERYRAEVARVSLRPPRIPFVSNLSGDWITAEQAVDPGYWVDHARRTARFGDALDQVWKLPDCVLLEVGPGRTLGVLASQHPSRPASRKPTVLASLRHDYDNQPDAELILNTLGALWLEGTRIDWAKVEEKGAKARLPSYPFAGQRHWIESQVAPAAAPAHRPAPQDWFYAPAWRRTDHLRPLRASEEAGQALWLVIGGASALAAQLVRRLEEIGCRAIAHADPAGDFLALLRARKGDMARGLNIIHFGALAFHPKPAEAGYDAASQEAGFFSLLGLAQALGDADLKAPVRLGVVTRLVHEVTGGEALYPSLATVLGISTVIAKEYPRVTSFALDLPEQTGADDGQEAWADRILSEFRSPSKGSVMAYRGHFRWERSYERQPMAPAELAAGSVTPEGLRRRGVYLITGGAGGIGLHLAGRLAQACQARLVLTRRTPFPARSAWSGRLASADAPEEEKELITRLLQIEADGGEVEIRTCDVSDRAGMQRLVSETLEKYGAINGVLHAAGTLKDGLIQGKTREAAAALLRPKVEGTWTLFEQVRGLELDFLILFSSLSSAIPFYGQSDYCAANSFLDAFAGFARGRAPFRTIAIGWPVWREVGMLTKIKTVSGFQALHFAVLRRAISNQEGWEVFLRALAAGPSQLSVSPQSLPEAAADSEVRPEIAANPAAAEPRSAGGTPIDGNFRDEVERSIAAIWARILGSAVLDRDQSFLDVGGHSLLAMQIVAEIRAAFRINFTLRRFFDQPTIAGAAEAVQSEVIAEIEDLSDEEVSRLAR